MIHRLKIRGNVQRATRLQVLQLLKIFKINQYSSSEKATKNPMRHTDDTKTIAGYTCQKVLMKDKESGANIILYITDKITPKGDPFAKYLVGELKGFPLGIVVRHEGTTVRVTAEKVSSRTPSDGAFSLSVPSGYELTTVEGLEKSAKKEIEKNR